MKIKVNYLNSEVVTEGNVQRRKALTSKNADAILINIVPGHDGTDYCHIILTETGELKKVAINLIEVVDSDYITTNSNGRK